MTPKTSRTSPVLLLDTNTWLDFYLPERTGHAAAFELVDLALAKHAALLYASLSAKDVFYLLSVALKRSARADGVASQDSCESIEEIAYGCLENMAGLATAVGIDDSDLWLARKLRPLGIEFEDGIIVAAAQRAGADYLVTRDERLLRKAPIAAKTPEDALALLRL